MPSGRWRPCHLARGLLQPSELQFRRPLAVMGERLHMAAALSPLEAGWWPACSVCQGPMCLLYLLWCVCGMACRFDARVYRCWYYTDTPTCPAAGAPTEAALPPCSRLCEHTWAAPDHLPSGPSLARLLLSRLLLWHPRPKASCSCGSKWQHPVRHVPEWPASHITAGELAATLAVDSLLSGCCGVICLPQAHTAAHASVWNTMQAAAGWAMCRTATLASASVAHVA